MEIKLIPLNKYQVGMKTYEDGFLVSYAIITPKEADAIAIKGGKYNG